MKKPITFLLSLLLCAACVTGMMHYSGKDQRMVKKVLKQELEQLKHMDEDTVSSYLSYQDMFPESKKEKTVSSEIQEIFPLFFQDFSYRIMDVAIDGNKAEASVRIQIIDARALAKDYMRSAMQKRIASSANPAAVESSLEDYYLLLRNLLKNGTYGTVEENCQLTLEKSGDDWRLKHTKASDNQLTGNFVSHLSDPALFTPEEIVALHFDTIKAFDLEQLNRYLQIDTLFDVDDAYLRSITQAVASQIHEYFDYDITGSDIDGPEASVNLTITSYDFKGILDDYERRLNAYLNTSKSLADGSLGRFTAANQMLLESIQSNTAVTATALTLELINDGSSWKLQITDEVAQAILGNMEPALAEISEDIKGDIAQSSD